MEFRSILIFGEETTRLAVAEVAADKVPGMVRLIARSPGEARPVLATEPVNLLVVGREFIEDVPSLLANSVLRPMTVLLVRAPSVADRARARHHNVDYVLDADEGADHVVGFIGEAFKTFVEPLAGDRDIVQMATDKIWISDEIDREIVQMIAAGYSDREIAEFACLNHQTVRNHVSRILGETGARNRTHLAVIYLAAIHAGTSPFDDEPRPAQPRKKLRRGRGEA